MAFTKEQKRDWRRLPHVIARQHEHRRKHEDKKRALGLRLDEPLDPARRKPRKPPRVKKERRIQKKMPRFPMPIRVSGRGRARAIRRAAIAALGGRCIECGIDDCEVLQIDHVVPVRRKEKRHEIGHRVYRRILHGGAVNVQLLCANCHMRKTRKDLSKIMRENIHPPLLEPELPLFDRAVF